MNAWKPGDVAMLTVSGVSLVAFREDHSGWRTADRDGWYGDGEDITVRPLVVIDPEDREQMERLATAWDNVGVADLPEAPMTLRAIRMQSALRSLIAPPRPVEPTRLGAVVEDDKGNAFVRIPNRSYSEDADVWFDDSGNFYSYADLAAVRVLSEGVTP